MPPSNRQRASTSPGSSEITIHPYPITLRSHNRQASDKPAPLQRKKRLSFDEKRDICDYARANPHHPRGIIAVKYNVSHATVYRVLKEKEKWLREIKETKGGSLDSMERTVGSETASDHQPVPVAETHIIFDSNGHYKQPQLTNEIDIASEPAHFENFETGITRDEEVKPLVPPMITGQQALHAMTFAQKFLTSQNGLISDEYLDVFEGMRKKLERYAISV
ncbi:hypothetical protein SCHPADRAFT_897388 [Schizopora paradoxa]|uniref:HTH psq-type domain-containing protein n=1 Tax=Schizopora paradoxa TaxID=27342 RepID=A0A0H2QXC8_9AGAM|nr:hypothetical protein SCHPADRAFT_897388 [Schizopora paradoxa]